MRRWSRACDRAGAELAAQGLVASGAWSGRWAPAVLASSWPPRAGGIPGVLRPASTYQARIAQRSGRSATGPSFSRQASTCPHQAESAARLVRNCRCLQSSYGQTSKAGSRSPLHGHVGLTPHMS